MIRKEGNPLLNTFTPPRYLNYFVELSNLMSTSGMPTPVQMRDLMARYDTEVVGMDSPAQRA